MANRILKAGYRLLSGDFPMGWGRAPNLARIKHENAVLKYYVNPKLSSKEQYELCCRIDQRLCTQDYTCHLPREPYPVAWKVKPRVRYKLTTCYVFGWKKKRKVWK